MFRRLPPMILAVFLCALAAYAQEQAPPDALKLYMKGDYQAVIAALQPAQAAGTSTIQERLILGRALLHTGKADQALEVLKSVLQSDKENPEANSLTGRILHEQGKDKDALEYLEQAHRLKPEPATSALLGQCYYALGQTVKAKAALEEAMAHDVRDGSNSLLLGRICLERGLGALAEKYLLMAQETGLDTDDLHLLLGRAYMLESKALGSVVVKHLPQPAKPEQIVDEQVVLGPVEGSPGKYKLASRYCALYEGYQLMARRKGDEASPLLAAGWLAAGETDLAEKHISILLMIAPTPGGDVRRLEAQLRLAQQDYKGLQSALAAGEGQKTLSLAEVTDYYFQAATQLRAVGNSEQAIAMLAMAESRSPASEKVLRATAEAYRAAGRTAEAARYYQRLVELLPDADDIDELRNTQKVLQTQAGGTK